jgi:hypothetical protein
MDIQRTITGTEPVTLSDIKAWLKVDFSTEDTLITALITEVREHIEQFTGRSLVASTIVLTVYGEADEPVYLPFPDIDEITESLPDSITEKGGKRKYIILGTDGEYQITYKTLGNCPSGVKLAIKKAVAENYINRQNTTELTAVKLPESTYHFLMQYTLP